MTTNGDNNGDKKYYVYILESSYKAATYVGATINLDHRLRQHNKELAGGAHATSVKVAQGSSWHRVCHVSGFPDWSAALQFEQQAACLQAVSFARVVWQHN